jgi:Rieske Fe-S protein
MLNKDLFEVWRQSKQQISRRRLLALMGAGGAAATATLSGCSVGSLIGGGSGTSSGGSTTTTSQGMQVATQQSTPAQSAKPTQASTQGSNVLAQVSQLPVNSARTFPIPNHQNPGVLIHLTDNSFVAFDTTCTHAQCAVAYNPAKNGSVVQGPAMAPLTAIKIVVNANGTITIA